MAGRFPFYKDNTMRAVIVAHPWLRADAIQDFMQQALGVDLVSAFDLRNVTVQPTDLLAVMTQALEKGDLKTGAGIHPAAYSNTLNSHSFGHGSITFLIQADAKLVLGLMSRKSITIVNDDIAMISASVCQWVFAIEQLCDGRLPASELGAVLFVELNKVAPKALRNHTLRKKANGGFVVGMSM